MGDVLNLVRGMKPALSQTIEMRLNELIAGIRDDIDSPRPFNSLLTLHPEQMGSVPDAVRRKEAHRQLVPGRCKPPTINSNGPQAGPAASG